MFEAAEVEQEIDKEAFKREVATLREQLLDAQGELRHADFPLILLIGGVDGAGKGETVNTLLEWLDPRFVHTTAVGEPSVEEAERPLMWRFWRKLPARGRIGIFFGGWHSHPIVDRVYRRTSESEMMQQLSDVNAFERLLVEDGALLVKFWMHLSKKRQRKRLRALAKDPQTRWRVTETDWKHFDLYDRFLPKVSATALRKTSTGDAPWTIVGASDRRFQLLSTVGRTILDRLRAHLAARRASKAAPAPAPAPAAATSSLPTNTILGSLDLAPTVTEDDYGARLEDTQGRLNAVLRRAATQGVSTVIVMEGVDAAGKGGAIRRFTGALDARMYRVVPIAAPTEDERAHPYLWRFWRHLPGTGETALFDRSWYGRVLVERVEGFCQTADWQRAVRRDQRLRGALARHGVVVVEVLAAHQPGRADAAVSRARADAVEALQDHRRGLAQPREVARLRARGQRDDRAHVDGGRAVDARRQRVQAVRAPQGARHRVRRRRRRVVS